MCGRFSGLLDPMVLGDVLALADSLCTFTPRTTVAPSQSTPVVVQACEGNVLKEMRWGLIPHWANDEKIGAKLFNARRETADQKPAFREAWRQRRCLVPSTGFYEWRRREGGEGDGERLQPFHFQRPDRGLFCFAGLWERWERPPARQGELFADSFEAPPPILETFTILTQRPNALVGAYHDRMPVMLEPTDGAAWLERGDLVSGNFVDQLLVEPVEI